ncbi:HAD-like domain-containing protein [Lineolata rhizophorae]|uniref:HAD-like domain-containing protein n=1 Tax=Lineolata rhizophorae TaxID=578093 RepID=A0A6A6PDQ5_9PEZI|nr:HAD-like domain-containing protein [Lineolata rhizophorae]
MEVQLPPIRACIFDVDGLLINSEDIYTEIYNNILREYGKPNYPWSIKALQQSRGTPGTRRLLDWAQLPLSIEEFGNKVSAQYDLFKKSQPLPGVVKHVRILSQETNPHMHMALASSAGRKNFDVKTSHLPEIASAFPENRRVFGDDEDMKGKQKKPNPDIFLLALDKINLSLQPGETAVAQNECLVFEDSIAGVEAGRRAGMRVIWVPHPCLRQVCRGWENDVLRGIAEARGFDGHPREDTLGGLESRYDNRFVSSDGFGELLPTLVDFPYNRYGISVWH